MANQQFFEGNDNFGFPNNFEPDFIRGGKGNDTLDGGGGATILSKVKKTMTHSMEAMATIS